ncbi:MAG: PqqD family protein, partial [Gemmatimonadaceae bacterium]
MKATDREDPAERRGARIARSPHGALAPKGDEAALVDLCTGAQIALNEVARRVWDLIDRESTFPAIVYRLRQEYTTDTAELAQQAGLILDEWLEEGFMTVDVKARRTGRVPASTRLDVNRAHGSAPNVSIRLVARGDARRRRSG